MSLSLTVDICDNTGTRVYRQELDSFQWRWWWEAVHSTRISRRRGREQTDVQCKEGGNEATVDCRLGSTQALSSVDVCGWWWRIEAGGVKGREL